MYNLDRETCRLLAFAVTFLPECKIDEIFGADCNSYQEIVAKEITSLIHGDIAGEKCATLSRDLAKLSPSVDVDSFEEILSPVRTAYIGYDENQCSLIDAISRLPCKPSKSELRRLSATGGLYLNFRPIHTSQLVQPLTSFADQIMLISFGRNSPYLMNLKKEQTI